MKRTEPVEIDPEDAVQLGRSPAEWELEEDPLDKLLKQLQWKPKRPSGSALTVTTLSGVFNEVDKLPKEKQDLESTINCIFHLLVFLRIGNGHGCDAKYLKNPWSLRGSSSLLAAQGVQHGATNYSRSRF